MIQHPDAFNQSKPANYDGLFDWDFLRSAFEPTKIEPTDIDAVVERCGNFLCFETKAPGVEIPMGQAMALERLIKLGRGAIFLIVLFGKTAPTIESMEIWYWKRGACIKTARKRCDSDYVLKRVRSWFEYASKVRRTNVRF